jgi:hypothetical protein
MTEPHTNSRILTQGRTSGKLVTELRSLGRTTPRSFSTHAWRRFAADRRARYVSRISGTPTDAHTAMVQSLKDVVRIGEARDLGDVDRYQFCDAAVVGESGLGSAYRRSAHSSSWERPCRRERLFKPGNIGAMFS